MCPQTYSGQLGLQQSKYFNNQDLCWIVNGMIYRASGNFRENFYMKKMQIGQKTNLYVGATPTKEEHVQFLMENKITAVLDLQTKLQHQQRSINEDYMLRLFKNRGINARVSSPVEDCVNLQTYCDDLFETSKHMEKLLNEGKDQKVFIHCTTGSSRTCTLLIVYYALYCRHPQWQQLDKIEEFVRTQNIYSIPNMPAIKKVINDNLTFQQQQKKLRDEEERNRLRDKEDDELAR